MAKVDLNPIFDTVRGKVGDLVLKRYGDNVVMARAAGETSRPRSAAQLAHQERFRAATQYGKLALMDPAQRSLYDAAARQRSLPVFAVMVADFFKAPTILSVDATEYTGEAGSRVKVLADDDFAVAGVQVVIATARRHAGDRGAGRGGGDARGQRPVLLHGHAGRAGGYAADHYGERYRLSGECDEPDGGALSLTSDTLPS